VRTGSSRPPSGGPDAQRALAARLRELLASAEPRAADHHGGQERPLQDLPREDRGG